MKLGRVIPPRHTPPLPPTVMVGVGVKLLAKGGKLGRKLGQKSGRSLNPRCVDIYA